MTAHRLPMPIRTAAVALAVLLCPGGLAWAQPDRDGFVPVSHDRIKIVAQSAAGPLKARTVYDERENKSATHRGLLTSLFAEDWEKASFYLPKRVQAELGDRFVIPQCPLFDLKFDPGYSGRAFLSVAIKPGRLGLRYRVVDNYLSFSLEGVQRLRALTRFAGTFDLEVTVWVLVWPRQTKQLLVESVDARVVANRIQNDVLGVATADKVRAALEPALVRALRPVFPYSAGFGDRRFSELDHLLRKGAFDRYSSHSSVSLRLEGKLLTFTVSPPRPRLATDKAPTPGGVPRPGTIPPLPQ